MAMSAHMSYSLPLIRSSDTGKADTIVETF